MIKDMAVGESLKKLNPNTTDITKVPTMLGHDEKIEDYYVFFIGGRCTKTRLYITMSNFKDSVFGKLDGFPFFLKMFI
jgi:hypothetical protein